jgi:vancomycin resistance protein VanW
VKSAVAIVCGLGALAAIWMQGPGEATLASFATGLDGRTRNQSHNAELSLRKLEGTVIGPGETFSFNETVGSYSRDQGFRKAPVSYNGQLITGWGGGVCQTSTTLYNAALLSGMEIQERHRHRFAPSYVELGRDAAVAYPDYDLKFRNPHPFPVRIRGEIRGASLVVRIDGDRPLAEPPQVVARVSGVQRPGEFTIGLSQGAPKIRNTGKPGAHVTVYRITGGRREFVSSDTYPVMHRIVEYQ